MPRSRLIARFALVLAAVLALAAGGCSGAANIFDKNEGGLFAKPTEFFKKSDITSTDGASVSLGPRGPVSPDDLVSADGRCTQPVLAQEPPAAVAQPAVAAIPADPAVGSMAGDLAGAPMPVAAIAPEPVPLQEPVFTPVLGGIALGMAECDVVRRAGLPSNVSSGVDDQNERKVVLTYLGGTWPGIYNFSNGRLKEISLAPEQPKPAKPASTKKTKKVVKKKPAARR